MCLSKTNLNHNNPGVLPNNTETQTIPLQKSQLLYIYETDDESLALLAQLNHPFPPSYTVRSIPKALGRLIQIGLIVFSFQRAINGV